MLVLSFLAGALTSVSPCVLPLIPILLGSAFQEHPGGPLALTLGLALSFTTLGVALSSIGFILGVGADTLRIAAAVLMACFGTILLSASLQERFALIGTPIMNRANTLLSGMSKAGLAGQFGLGLLLGLIWAPCAGPTLGAAVGLAANGGTALRAALMMFLFSLGTATPILALAYGSRRLASHGRSGMRLFGSVGKPAMGVALLAIGIFVLSGIDKTVEASLTQAMPDWLLDLVTRI
ncbi:MAG TPA: cytochrome c biogenesis CcdA family protein [Stellaceae bacterium]|nr:cytochrome c biogenesis CcdA family protein [Stellaceae bacterium]